MHPQIISMIQGKIEEHLAKMNSRDWYNYSYRNSWSDCSEM